MYLQKVIIIFVFVDIWSMIKISESGAGSISQEARIRRSGSVLKCHGSATLLTSVLLCLEWVSSLVSLQTAILEKKTRQGEPKDRMSTPKPEVLHQEDPPCTEDQPDKEASTVDDQDVRQKDSILADTKSDDVSPKTDVEKDIDAGLDKLDKAEEGKGSDPKISASQASPGSSTISGKGRKVVFL
jgi:hypothetical protein